MFTGVVLGCGTVRSFAAGKNARRLAVDMPKNFPKIKAGGSISVDGACLTLTDRRGKVLFFDVVPETLRRTCFGGLKKGARVHLEPALGKNDRIEGHFVQGHVDGVGTVRKVTRAGHEVCVQIAFPLKLKPYLFEKGSVAVDGVSLTVGPVKKRSFLIYLIPHTLKRTHFGDLKAGCRVNLEADVLVKFLKTMSRAH